MPSAARLFFLAVFTLFQSSHANDPVKSVQSAPSEICAINPKAIVSDACASYSTLDNLNTALAPSLKSITQSTDFFAYYRLNLYDQKCPVKAWDDETGTCGNIACKVDTLEDEKDIPVIWRASELSKLEGPKAAHPGKQLQKERGSQRPLQGTLGENVGESCVVEYDDECDERDYCIPEDESATAKGDYVSLVDNPERYTGYAGQPVWDAIYRENCFFKSLPPSSISSPPLGNPFGNSNRNNKVEAAAALRNVIQANTPKSEFILDDTCLEKRVFHRIISGMHASISTHICADYLNQTTGTWGPNLQCYTDRLATHPERVSNLYFNYALLLRAVTKLRTYLKNYTFCSGDIEQDTATKTKILHLADSAAAQPRIFDESFMFQDPHDAGGLKEDFRNRFRNVSRLMDCVGCDKCRLWGKLQTVGYGTALKVLFEYEEDKNGENPPLRRTELVALVNTLDRVARSLTALGEMRALVLANEEATSASRSKVLQHPDTVSASASASAPTFDDFEEDNDDPSSHSADPSILTAFKEELALVFRTLFYVLRSWVELPSKVIQITLLEASRAWNFWLGLPVQPRDYAWEFDFGDRAPGRGGRGGEKGEL
ncbi:endoplasmic oxidoreductin-1 [Xanthoria parietina]